jgi:hypothetical protein
VADEIPRTNVVQLPIPANATLDKRALARHWGCSTRLIEKFSQAGMPKGGLDCYGRRVYQLAACEEWRQHRPKPEAPAKWKRLEDEVRDLRSEVQELKRRLDAEDSEK